MSLELLSIIKALVNNHNSEEIDSFLIKIYTNLIFIDISNENTLQFCIGKLLIIYSNSSNNINNKSIADKISIIIDKLRGNINLLVKVINKIFDLIGVIIKSNLEKFVLLFFLCFQSIQIEEMKEEESSSFIIFSKIIVFINGILINISTCEIDFQYITKTLILIAKGNNDDRLKSIIEFFIEKLIEENNNLILHYLKNEDCLALILIYLHSLEDKDKRQMIASYIILSYGDYTEELVRKGIKKERISEIIFRLVSKDNDIEVIKDLYQSLDKDILVIIDQLFKLKKAQEMQKEQELQREQEREAKSKINVEKQNEEVKPMGKLKTLKIGKK